MKLFAGLLILLFSLYAKANTQQLFLATELFNAMNTTERTDFTLYIRNHINTALMVSQLAQKQKDIAPIAQCIQSKLQTATITVRSASSHNCAGAAGFISRADNGTIYLCPRAWAAYSYDNTVLTLIHEASHLCNSDNNEIQTELVTIRVGLAAYNAGMKNFLVQCQPSYCSTPLLLSFTQKNKFDQMKTELEQLPEHLARRKYREDFFNQRPNLLKIRIENFK